MKKVKVLVMVVAASFMLNSCLGSFSAFNNLRSWNESVTNEKFLNNLIFWGLNIIPVYPLFMLGDVIIFNVIEFWSGSNPIAMKEGEVESQILVKDGKTYQMIATKNKMEITVIKGENEGKSIEMFYLPSEQSWNLKTDEGEVIKLSSFEEGLIYVYLPNGETIKMNPEMDTQDGMAIINNKLNQQFNVNVAAN